MRRHLRNTESQTLNSLMANPGFNRVEQLKSHVPGFSMVDRVEIAKQMNEAEEDNQIIYNFSENYRDDDMVSERHDQ